VSKNPANAAMRWKDTGQAIQYPISYTLPMTGTIFFTDSKGLKYPRKIRYAEGENSIFVDEQTPDDKYPKRPIKCEFVKGRFRVDGQNSTLLKFMMTWDMNESKIGRDNKKQPVLRLIDNSIKAEAAQKDEDLLFDVVDWCRNADWETKVQPLCAMIFREEDMMQPAKEIRYNLTQVARKDPKSFKKMLEDPKTERTIVVRAAIEKGFIVKDSSLSSLFWTDNGSVPLSIAAPGKDIIEDFVNKSFSGKGEEIYKAINDLVNPSEEYVASTKQEARVIEQPILKPCTDTDEELQFLVRDAVTKGFITVNQTRVWWKYKGDSSKGEPAMVAKLKDNALMLQSLKKDCGIE
jgi:hypothetical protein